MDVLVIRSILPIVPNLLGVFHVQWYQLSNGVLSVTQARTLFQRKMVKNMVGESDAWTLIVNEVEALSSAPSSVTVLLTGETGTGKEVVSRAIHAQSGRRHNPFIAINCAAIPSELLESVLFGYEKGAFTGAYAKTVGKFEMAEGGTILLDEIGEMSLPLQAKLLRVLQEKTIDRIGGREPIPVDVRIIAATHCDLQRKVLHREFREDLFYRLNVYPIELPALRDRASDVPLLLDYAIQNLARNGYVTLQFSAEAMSVLQSHRWPGNVRELMNLAERLAVKSAQKGSTEITAEDLPASYRSGAHQPADILTAELSGTDPADLFQQPIVAESMAGQPIPQGFHLGNFLRSIEKQAIHQAMVQTSENVAQAARLLGIPRTTLISKLQMH